MATSTLPFDDQTDEDFFDKLVNDEIDVSGSNSEEKDSKIESCSDLKENDSKKIESCSDLKEEYSAEEKDSIESKGKSLKIVQWSSFSLDNESDFLNENLDGFGNISNSQNVDVSNEQYSFDSKGFGDLTSSQNVVVDSNVFGNGIVSENVDVINEQIENVSGNQCWENVTSMNDLNGSQNWENLYPGWKYDHSTGQWYQTESLDMSVNTQNESYNANDGYVVEDKSHGAVNGFVSNEKSEVSFFQHTAKSIVETIDVSHEKVRNEYPPNMVFDPQYPEWYYDTNTQQWYMLESYSQSIQNTASKVHEQNSFGQFEQSVINSYAQKNMWQPDISVKSMSTYAENQLVGNFRNNSVGNGANYADQQKSFKMFEPVANNNFNGNANGFQNFVPKENVYQFNQTKVQQTLEDHLSTSYYEDYSQPQFQNTNASHSQFPYVNGNRSSAGRPSHALVTFGFGGKLIVMKESNTLGAKLGYDTQVTSCGTISVLNLMEVVMDKVDSFSSVNDSCGYFNALCRQSFPGPLVGGNAGAKDVNKWIDEKIQFYESSTVDVRKGEQLKLLLSLLKISCQHYGKLRSPFGANLSLEETDGPESAVTKLFTSSAHSRGYRSSTCMQNFPSEGKILATAVDMQNLLVSGRRKEALHCAQAGQLWGPALVLASQLGEKYYVETVKQMAQHQFISGSPLRTLCLLIAGQPADVFSTNNSSNSDLSVSGIVPQLNTEIPGSMLNEWEENLAIITANRTKDDEFVIVHLGDCLWKEKEEVTAAHTCYLVAEANFESYSESARLCLIGADHWKSPRTYACPEAIQRTEIYEHSKLLGNSQFVLLQFQPYKLVYAYMLAEAGKVTDSLRYCQASLKLLKNSNRAPEVETWKSQFSYLEERLKTHQLGGYSTNSTPSKLVGKLFTTIDRSINRMMGGPTSPLPPMPQSSINGKENYTLASSQSTMAMSSLIPSASVEGINEWNSDSNRKNMHARSISEPDFGRNSKQDSSKETSLSDAESRTSASRFGRIGSQLLKTVGWVSRSRQAKLGETNKFYYDEKLKRWIEEGADPPAEEIAPPPPPPPTTALFRNGNAGYNLNNAFKIPNNGAPEVKSPTPTGHSSGIPPLSPSPNQFSARGRMGVRSRYVDTFNKSGGGASLSNSFPSPPVPSLKPLSHANFFVPSTPANPEEQKVDSTTKSENLQIPIENKEHPLQTTFTKPSGLQRFPSMNNLPPSGNNSTSSSLASGDESFSSHSRRASWSGEMYKASVTRPLTNGGNYGDLHEVAL